jgi:hypothetical protein
VGKVLTRYGVAYDLENTPFVYKVKYGSEIYEYKFSSKLYLDKFMNKSFDYRKQVNESLTNRFGFTIINDIISDLKLYTTIEKRGFLIYKGLVKVECLNDITLDGSQMITKS